MALVDLEMPVDDLALPADVVAFLREVDERIHWFIEERKDHPIRNFVPSDFKVVYAALRTLTETGLAPGNWLCEWGCGFGVVACLAAMLEFNTCGIEIEPDLHEAAETLADDFGLPVEFACGTYIPPGAEALTEVVDEDVEITPGGQNAYEDLRLDPDDFDIVFAYPWPGEEWLVEKLFERYAVVGAILMTYNGKDGVRLQRKVRSRRGARTVPRS